MDLKNLGRNDLCPCGSGEKFKRCHLGREKELIEEHLAPDPQEVAERIGKLPSSKHATAAKWSSDLELTSPTGQAYTVKVVDLHAYVQLNLDGKEAADQQEGGVLINPTKTRALDPHALYLALSRKAGDSTVVHQLAHCQDLISGSRLPHGRAAEVAGDTGVPIEFLEHPQEYGDILLEMSERFEVKLDAEDEIVAFLARRKLLLPAALVAKAERASLIKAVEKALGFLNENQAEINARIQSREGYIGDKG